MSASPSAHMSVHMSVCLIVGALGVKRSKGREREKHTDERQEGIIDRHYFTKTYSIGYLWLVQLFHPVCSKVLRSQCLVFVSKSVHWLFVVGTCLIKCTPLLFL